MNNKQQHSLSWPSLAKKIRAASRASVVQKISAPLGKVRRLLRPPSIELVTLTASEKYSGQSLSVDCGLSKQNYFLWTNLLFGEAQIAASAPQRRTITALFSGSTAADLTIVPMRFSDFTAFNGGRWLFIPEWTSGVIKLPLPANCLSQERVKSDLRRIRNNGFSYDVTRDPHMFDEFYRDMYLPYISRRHGEEALFDNFAAERKNAEEYDLLLVKQPDNPQHYIAGVMIIYEAEGPRLWSLGVRDGGNYVQQGVIAALYHFAFKHVLENGFAQIRTGGSRAFLDDGVFRFKRKLHQEIIGSNWKGFALRIAELTPASKAFLLNNPFIIKHDDGLSGVLFSDAASTMTERDIRRLYKNYAESGLNYLSVYFFDEMSAANLPAVPDDLHDGLRFYSASALL